MKARHVPDEASILKAMAAAPAAEGRKPPNPAQFPPTRGPVPPNFGKK